MESIPGPERDPESCPSTTSVRTMGVPLPSPVGLPDSDHQRPCRVTKLVSRSVIYTLPVQLWVRLRGFYSYPQSDPFSGSAPQRYMTLGIHLSFFIQGIHLSSFILYFDLFTKSLGAHGTILQLRCPRCTCLNVITSPTRPSQVWPPSL